MSILFNANILRMSILFCNFVVGYEGQRKALKLSPLKFHVEQKSNLNPKSRKGTETMNNNYQYEKAAILQKAQRDIIYKAIDAIAERNSQMQKLLENGRGIFEHAQGDRFSRIYEQRGKLWMKMEENSKAIGILWDTLNNECVKC